MYYRCGVGGMLLLKACKAGIVVCGTRDGKFPWNRSCLSARWLVLHFELFEAQNRGCVGSGRLLVKSIGAPNDG